MMRLSLFALTVLVGSLHLFGAQSFCQTNGSTAPEKNIDLRDRLSKIGDKFGCYFTLEIGLVSGNRSKSLENIHLVNGQNLDSKPQGNSLGQELERLRKIVPNFSYRFDGYNRKVIHIIDVRLYQDKSYAMETIVDDLHFDGTLFDLLNAISQKSVAISAHGSMDTRELFVLDHSTEVRVNEKNKKVRNILTSPLAVKDRGRILWIAETELGKGRTTYVRYLK